MCECIRQPSKMTPSQHALDTGMVASCGYSGACMLGSEVFLAKTISIINIAESLSNLGIKAYIRFQLDSMMKPI